MIAFWFKGFQTVQGVMGRSKITSHFIGQQQNLKYLLWRSEPIQVIPFIVTLYVYYIRGYDGEAEIDSV